MADYDNTNSGAAFRPYDDQKLILQGKLNVDGDEQLVVVTKQPVKRGSDPVLVVWAKIGVLFPNEKNGNERAPDYSGPIEGYATRKRIAAWKNSSEKAGSFLSFKASDVQGQDGAPVANTARAAPEVARSHNDTNLDDDEIPF